MKRTSVRTTWPLQRSLTVSNSGPLAWLVPPPGANRAKAALVKDIASAAFFVNEQIENNRWHEIFTRLIDTNRLTGVYQAGIIGLNFGRCV